MASKGDAIHRSIDAVDCHRREESREKVPTIRGRGGRSSPPGQIVRASESVLDPGPSFPKSVRVDRPTRARGGRAPWFRTLLQGEGSAKTGRSLAPMEEDASAQPVKPVLPKVGVPEGSLIYLLPENFLWVELPLDVLI